MGRTPRALRAAASAAVIALSAPLSAALVATTAHATEMNPGTIPATGTFTFTTWPGILPAWSSEEIVIVGISPGSVITAANDVNARVSMPIVAKTGTANAAAGGFRLVNTDTGKSVRCQVPTIDTRARAVACVFADGTETTFFDITEIESRSKVTTARGTTTLFQGMELRFISNALADQLNKALDTTVFSASVKIATGELVVSR